jgi:CheY-like chemotaxis protein
MAKILLVDDERDIRFVMSELLEDMGHEVIEASSAPGGLEMLESERPDLIVLDLTMPDMSGIEALAQIRRREATRHTRVLLLTGSVSTEELDKARKLGIEGIIPKPWESADIASQVAAAMADSRAGN